MSDHDHDHDHEHDDHLELEGRYEGVFDVPDDPSGSHEGAFHLDLNAMIDDDNPLKSILSGHGEDSIGSFQIHGTYNTNTKIIHFTKQYNGAHSVEFNGKGTPEDFEGEWTLPDKKIGTWKMNRVGELGEEHDHSHGGHGGMDEKMMSDMMNGMMGGMMGGGGGGKASGPQPRETILSEDAPKPIGPYSQAIRVGDLLFVSGCIAIDAKTGEFQSSATIEAQTELSLSNMKNIIEAGGLELSNVVKTTLYLTTMSHYSTVNTIYEKYFPADVSPPARTCVAVAALPKGALFEIDAIACASVEAGGDSMGGGGGGAGCKQQ